MFRQMLYPTLTALGFLWMGGAVSAQPLVFTSPSFRPGPGYGHKHGHHFHVQYRQLAWEERSFSHRYEARRFAELKEDQGFETRLVRHGGHWDVQYRMPHWQTYRTVPSHRQAHDLEHYLEYRGYQARVIHH